VARKEIVLASGQVIPEINVLKEKTIIKLESLQDILRNG